jgi:hypothetical protein
MCTAANQTFPAKNLCVSLNGVFVQQTLWSQDRQSFSRNNRIAKLGTVEHE